MYKIDLEEIGFEEYLPKSFKIDKKGRKRFNDFILSQSREKQIPNLVARIFDLIGNLYPFGDTDIKLYLTRIIDAMDGEQIRDCLERDISYVGKIKNKINKLASEYSHKQFLNLLDVDKIFTRPIFTLPEYITPNAKAPSIIPKSLYVNEAAIGNFERRIINDIANLENIQWWHRNLSKGKGFKINGFINHYPDFIVKTKNEKILLIETKGDDRDNSDSQLKLKLGKLWENKTGGSFKYMMIFDSNPIEGAEKLTDALGKISQL